MSPYRPVVVDRPEEISSTISAIFVEMARTYQSDKSNKFAAVPGVFDLFEFRICDCKCYNANNNTRASARRRRVRAVYMPVLHIAYVAFSTALNGLYLEFSFLKYEKNNIKMLLRFSIWKKCVDI